MQNDIFEKDLFIDPNTSTLSTVTDLPDDFELSDEFSRAFDLMENTNEHIFLTGRAGTGKSTLLSYFRKNTKKNIAVVAPTGIAAMNIGGQTIHSFFDFPLTYINPDAIHSSKKLKSIYENIDTIVVDEISMVRADMIDGMDRVLRINKDISQIFGGVQMIFIGDLFQLPPVVSFDSRGYITTNYESPYFFDAKIFKPRYQDTLLTENEKLFELKIISLENIFRQRDPVFKEILNHIREDQVSRNDFEVLNSRFLGFGNLTQDIKEFVDEDKSDNNQIQKENDLTIILTATNEIASNVNSSKLNNIKNSEFTYEAEIAGDFPEKAYPTDKELRLKIGSQVMMLKNDPERRFVNGTLAVVEYLDKLKIIVRIQGKSYEIEKANWRVIEYAYVSERNRVEEIEKGVFHQYPIKLAWAITIHKSQGQTFDKVILDIGRGTFAHGQLYVALSRCRSLDGIILKQPIMDKDLIVDQRVIEFMKRK